MSYRRNNTSATTTTHTTRRPAPAGQRSYIVSIDTGSFANVEIVVGDYHHRSGAGVWTPTPSSRAAETVKVVTSKSHVYAYGMLLGVSPADILPLSVLQPLTLFSPPALPPPPKR
jgi:hypothetical protein